MKSDEIGSLQSLISNCEKSYEDYKDSFKAVQMAYLLEHNEEKSKKFSKLNKSNIYIPKLRTFADILKATLNSVYFQSDKIAVLDGFKNTDSSIIQCWQDALDYYFSQTRFYDTAQSLFATAITTGTAVAKVEWDYDKPRIKAIDIDNIFFDPEAKTKDDIRVVIEQFYIAPSVLKEYISNEIYKDIYTEEEELDEKRLLIKDIYQKEGDKWYITSIHESFILREKTECRDGLPFVFGYMLKQLRKIEEETYNPAYGESPLLCILPFQQEVNILANAMIDGANQSLNRKLLINKSTMINPEALIDPIRPIAVNSPSDVVPLAPPDLRIAFQQLQLIDSQIADSTGLSTQNMGGSGSVQPQSATEISIQSSEIGLRKGDYIRNLNETFIEPLIEKLAKLVWKYGDNSFFMGCKRHSIPSFAFEIQTGDGSTNKEVQKVGISNAISIIQGQMANAMQMQDTEEAYKCLNAMGDLTRQMVDLLNVQDRDNLFKLSEEAQAKIEQQEMMAQQQQAMMEQQQAMQMQMGQVQMAKEAQSASEENQA